MDSPGVLGGKYIACLLHSVSSLLDATKKTEDVLRWGCGCAQKDGHVQTRTVNHFIISEKLCQIELHAHVFGGN